MILNRTQKIIGWIGFVVIVVNEIMCLISGYNGISALVDMVVPIAFGIVNYLERDRKSRPN
jgi:hypothetical protein